MSRALPIEEGKIYHLYNHANGSEDLFGEGENFRHFLRLYRKYIYPIADTFSYCLLPNHVHFLVKIKDRRAIKRHFDFLVREEKVKSVVLLNLQGLKDLGGPHTSLFISHQLSNLFNSYTKSLNKATGRKGSLFQQNIRRKPVENIEYLHTLIRYINLNPVLHGFVNDPHDWPHSSLREFQDGIEYIVNSSELYPFFGSRLNFENLHTYLNPGSLNDLEAIGFYPPERAPALKT